jgi:hypothetical protein
MANPRQRPLSRLRTGLPVVLLIALALAPGSASTINPWSFPEVVVEPTSVGARAVNVGRTFSRWFEEGSIDRLWPRLSSGLQRIFGTASGLANFRRKVHQGAGEETSVLEERAIPWLRSVIYNRAIHRSSTSDVWWTQWTLDDERATAFLVQRAPTAAASTLADYRTRTSLRLPFHRSWFVFWGGRTVLENYHAASAARRFAYDFVVARAGRTSRDARPSSNGDFLCFGRPVLAPADGAVVAAVGRVPDNTPGRMNEEQPLGNHVVLDHGNGEFSFLAHLRNGSLRVRPGQRVRSGEPLGQCGNSGRSSQPHLHFHLQTTRGEDGKGLPAQFTTYWADGASVERGEPRRGQFVAPGAASTFDVTLDPGLPNPWASFVRRP